MRYLTTLALLALACAADPVPLPDVQGVPDAGPCGGACGAGTACEGGACVAVDGGGAVGDAGADAPPAVDLGAPMDVDAPGAVADAGHVAPRDVDPRQSEVCRGVTVQCEGRTVDVQGGERDGGVYRHCGGCGVNCATGEFCVNCVCER